MSLETSLEAWIEAQLLEFLLCPLSPSLSLFHTHTHTHTHTATPRGKPDSKASWTPFEVFLCILPKAYIFAVKAIVFGPVAQHTRWLTPEFLDDTRAVNRTIYWRMVLFYHLISWAKAPKAILTAVTSLITCLVWSGWGCWCQHVGAPDSQHSPSAARASQFSWNPLSWMHKQRAAVGSTRPLEMQALVHWDSQSLPPGALGLPVAESTNSNPW